MAKQYTLQDLTKKLKHPEILYMSYEQKKNNAINLIGRILISNSLDNTMTNKERSSYILSAFIKADEYLSNEIDLQDLQGLTDEQKNDIEQYKQDLDRPQYINSLVALVNEDLNALYSNAIYIDYLYEWAGEPAKNGKENLYSIWKDEGLPYFHATSWVNIFTHRTLTNKETGKKLSKQEFFLYLKGLEQKRLETIIALSLDNGKDLYKQFSKVKNLTILQKLQALSWETINDRHIKRPVKVKVPIIQELKPVNEIWYTGILENIGSLKVSSVVEYEPKKESDIASFFTGLEDEDQQEQPNNLMQITYSIPSGKLQAEIYRSKEDIEKEGPALFSMTTDKLLKLFRTELRQYNSKDLKQHSLTLSLATVMKAFGYTEEEIKNPTEAKNFYKKVNKALEALYRSSFKYISKNTKDELRIISRYQITLNNISVEFSDTFIKYLTDIHFPPTCFTKSLLSIPDRERLAFRTFDKLTNNYTNKGKIGAGHEDRLSIEALYTYLSDIGEIPTIEAERKTTRLYKQRIVKPILKALNYLQDTGRIEYELYLTEEEYTDIDGSSFNSKEPIDQYELEAYYSNVDQFLKLKINYTILEAEGWVEARKPALVAEQAKKIKAIAQHKRTKKKTEAVPEGPVKEEAPDIVDLFH